MNTLPSLANRSHSFIQLMDLKNMPERVMLILIGGRSAVPAIVGALQCVAQVDRIKFLVCRSEHNRYIDFQKRTEEVLKQENQKLNCEENDIKVVESNNFSKVYEAVDELCKPDQVIEYVNLTSAPQTMAIAVYSYIKEKYPKALIFAVNTDQAQLTPLMLDAKPLPLSKKLTVEEYAMSCGVEIKKKKSSQIVRDYLQKGRPLFEYFIEQNKITDLILAEIRKKAGGGDSITAPRSFTIEQDKLLRQNIVKTSLENFFGKLEESLIIQNLNITDTEISYKFQTNEDYAFLKGGWLEFLVYDAAQKCHFDSVEMSVDLGEIYGGEIDIVCVSGVNTMVCECKTGDPKNFDSNELSKLKSRGDKFGESYCVKLFVTNQELSKVFLDKAADSKIVVVSGNDLKSLPEILSREMQKPTYERR